MSRKIGTAALLAAIGTGRGARVRVAIPSGRWIGMKFGDQPGQLIRGWICERPSVPETKAEPVAATDSPLKPSEDKRMWQRSMATIANCVTLDRN
jgi:hypothetical protein